MAVLVVFWLAFAGFGCWIASVKNREPVEGFIVGLIFGPLGCLVEAILPTLVANENIASTPKEAEQACPIDARILAAVEDRIKREQARQDEAAHRRAVELEDWRLKREAQLAAQQREQDFIAARENEEAWERNRETLRSFVRFWIRFGWFRALPDTLQPILIGLAVAAPIVAVIVKLLGNNQ